MIKILSDKHSIKPGACEAPEPKPNHNNQAVAKQRDLLSTKSSGIGTPSAPLTTARAKLAIESPIITAVMKDKVGSFPSKPAVRAIGEISYGKARELGKLAIDPSSVTAVTQPAPCTTKYYDEIQMPPKT